MAISRLFSALALAVFLSAAPALAQLSTAGNQLWRQGADGIAGNPEGNDRFASTLAAGDFNGDGWDDLAVGAPGESSSRGIIHVIYGGPGGLSSASNQTWEQGVGGIDGNAETNDFFGGALAAGDFNGDGYDDLVASASGEDDARGIVQAIYGSASGLTSQNNQAWRQGSNDIRDSAETGDSFGFSLAVGDFNGDGFDDVAAGGPGENNSAGLVIVIFGGAGGLTSNGNQRWREGDDGLRGDAENLDLFGYELAAADFNGDGFDDLAVGTPGENSQRGTVNILYGSGGGGLIAEGNVRRQQGDDGIPDDDEDGDGFAEVMTAGDFNGDGFADLAASALGEDSARGTVTIIPGSSSGLSGAGSSRLRQAEDGIGGDSRESGDRFGSAIISGDFNADGFADLAIGVRGEDSNRGLVQILYGSSGGLTPGTQVFAQGAAGLLDQAESSDDFGFDFAAGNFGVDPAADLAIGAPGEDSSRGVAHVLFGRSLVPAPVVAAVVGAGLSVPAVAQASYNAIVTVFGENFQAAATAALRPEANQGGALPTIRDGVCVEMNGRRTPLFAVFPGQINLQASITPGVNAASVVVILNCDQPNALRSATFNLPIAAATPEFFFFVGNASGVNPIAAVNETTGAFVGAPGLIPGAVFEAARPNEVVTVFLTGLGETNPRWEVGQLPTAAAATTLPVRIQIGGADVDTIYAGVTPGFAGLYQASFRIPADAAAGDLPLRVTVGAAAATPAGGFITVRR